MSLTVSQLLELPCLRRARVLAGHKSLDRIVTSISVLEYAAPTETQKKLYESIEFWGSELVITGFCSVADDVDAQCANIRSMAAAGEVGMILYYVGLILPSVDPRLIRLADELDFVLICMPENEPNLRYSEVIQEGMGAIIRDELNNPTFTLDLLEQIAKVPKSQQTVKTILRITSDRLRATALITDADYHILSEAPWPRNQTTRQEELMQVLSGHTGAEIFWEVRGERPLWVYQAEIHPGGGSRMHLIVISESGKFDSVLWKQAVEGVRLGMSVWGKQHDQVDLSGLVRAIIQDEPIKMRRLGDLYHIDVEALSDVWILKNLSDGDLSRWVSPIRELSTHFAKIEMCELYENDILIFPVGSRTLRDMNAWAAALVDFCWEHEIPVKITRCPLLQNTADVKYAYEMNHAYLTDAIRVFPLRPFFTISEIEFVKECREIAEAGKESVRWYTALLDPFQDGRDGPEILRTLEVYLLDQNSSIVETASQLFVHKNTVKYRLQKAGDILGFRIGDVPQSKNLIYALSLRRIMVAAEAEPLQ